MKASLKQLYSIARLVNVLDAFELLDYDTWDRMVNELVELEETDYKIRRHFGRQKL